MGSHCWPDTNPRVRYTSADRYAGKRGQSEVARKDRPKGSRCVWHDARVAGSTGVENHCPCRVESTHANRQVTQLLASVACALGEGWWVWHCEPSFWPFVFWAIAIPPGLMVLRQCRG